VSPNGSSSVLVVDDEEVIRDVLEHLLGTRGGHDLHLATNGAEALKLLARQPVDLVLLDLMLPGTSGLELLQRFKSDDPELEIIMMTAHGSVETAVEAMKAGAFHYLTKPFQNDEVILLVEKALRQRRLREENKGLKKALAETHRTGRLVGRSAPLQRVLRTIEQVAAARTTVLITGESGTGKELTAAAIHDAGADAGAPFITVNSSNLPPDLLESQLFGHAKGAFTGADEAREGLFAAAAGGTIFFDEISSIPVQVQAKLLRVMQEKEFLPLGSVEPVRVDVRIIAATNEDLEAKVEEGTFREDLFYRLNVITVPLPPLRERRDDIPLLVKNFLERYRNEHARPRLRIGPRALRALVRFDWPGNVRQLQNSIERVVLLAEREEVQVEDLPAEVREGARRAAGRAHLPEGQTFQAAVEDYERALIRSALEEVEGVQRRAAERLGMKPTTLSERMKRLGIR